MKKYIKNIKYFLTSLLILLLLGITVVSATAYPVAYPQGACTSSYNYRDYNNYDYNNYNSYSYSYYEYSGYEYSGWGLRRYNYHQPYYYPYYRQNSRHEYW